jgi:hypothetical protein
MKTVSLSHYSVIACIVTNLAMKTAAGPLTMVAKALWVWGSCDLASRRELYEQSCQGCERSATIAMEQLDLFTSICNSETQWAGE